MVANQCSVSEEKQSSKSTGSLYNQPVRVSISAALPLTRLQTNKCCKAIYSYIASSTGEATLNL